MDICGTNVAPWLFKCGFMLDWCNRGLDMLPTSLSNVYACLGSSGDVFGRLGVMEVLRMGVFWYKTEQGVPSRPAQSTGPSISRLFCVILHSAYSRRLPRRLPLCKFEASTIFNTAQSTALSFSRLARRLNQPSVD